ncbi:hypothetical protein [Roseicyclus sp.]|uniref:hypothetical protein n=1 Tax=Roseicyclus sp. TaxID=1914329 RepID=UPI003F6B4977
MARGNPTRADDERLLRIIDARIKGHISGPEIRKRYGITNSALSGIMNRYRASEAECPCACVKPENRAGGMPDRWWE